MRKSVFLVAAVVAIPAAMVLAQPPNGPPRRPDGDQRRERLQRGNPPPPEERGRQGRYGEAGGNTDRFGPPPNPILHLLDKDRDGEVSAAELDNAESSIRELDRDGDGTLSREELRPPHPLAGDRRGAARGRARGDARGGPADRGPRSEGGRDRNPPPLLKQDRDGDGQITPLELLHEPVRRMFERSDANGDGVLDEDETQQAAQKLERGDRGGRPQPGERKPPRRDAEEN